MKIIIMSVNDQFGHDIMSKWNKEDNISVGSCIVDSFKNFSK